MAARAATLRKRLARKKPSATRVATPQAAPVKSRSRVLRPSRVPAQRSPLRRRPAVAAAPARTAERTTTRAAAPTTAPVPSPFAPLPQPDEAFQIPSGYGEHKLVLMVRDPWWVFAYWEVDPQRERATRTQLAPHEVPGMTSVLRVYNVTGVDYPHEPANSFFDIPLSGLAMNWYIHTNAPNASFIVELGLRTAQGRFVMLLRSNRVTTPRDGPSEVIDEQWSVSDEAFTQLFSGPVMPGGSPAAGWGKLLDHYGSSTRSTAGATAVNRPPAMRNLWVRADTDLVVYGRTDPKARLTIEGHPVPVHADGSFRFRAALPDGTQTIAVTVTSPDGRQVHTVTPVVSMRRDAAADGGRAARPVQPFEGAAGG